MSAPFLSASWYQVAALRLRLRTHAKIHRQRFRGQPWYILQDPSSGRMHRFSPEAYLVVSLMDGQRSLDEIWNRVAAEMGEDAPSQDEVIQLLGQLHGADVLASDVTPDAAELYQRHRKQSRATLRKNLLNPLAFRIPLWDPDRFLDRTRRRVDWIFGPLGLLLWLAAVVPALVLAGIHWEALTGNLSDRVLSGQNLLLLWLVYPVVKLLHELGHAYTVKSGGGEVHELGVMFLVLTPVPYVDASAATAFRSKARRALVGAAGMLVELFLAALAMFVWVSVEPGLARSIAFNVMLIGGVSTVIFNGNPLLRFDGYYILADLIEIPNLGQRAARYWGYLVQRYAFRQADPQSSAHTRGERLWLAFYGVASFVYRLMVMFGIAIFIASEFFVVGVVLAIWGVATSVLWPMAKALGYVLNSPALQRRRRRAVSITFGTLVLLAAFIAFVPMPSRSLAEGVTWVPEQAEVRAEARGFVDRLFAAPDAQVAEGQLLAQASDPDLAAEIDARGARIERLEVQLAGERFQDPAQAAVTREELDKERSALDRLRERADELTVVARQAGRFVVPRAADLPGRFVRQGELIGYVLAGPPRTVRVVVEQADIEQVRSALRHVEVRIADRLDSVYPADIVREVPGGQDRLPNKALGLEGGGLHATDPRDAEGMRTLERLFQFDLALPEEVGQVAVGTRVFARLDFAAEPLGVQWYRGIRRLFLSRFNV